VAIAIAIAVIISIAIAVVDSVAIVVAIDHCQPHQPLPLRLP
jgi:hypothetical protein